MALAMALAIRLEVRLLIDADTALTRAATDAVRPHAGLRVALLSWQQITRPVWPYAATAVVAAAVAVLAPRQRARALWAVGTCLLGWGVAILAKALVRRARPYVSDPLEVLPGHSFPSGHATNAAVVATVLVILLWPVLSRRGRGLAVVAALAYAGLTGPDRVLLGVHYPSDVIAGWALGAGVVLASGAMQPGGAVHGEPHRPEQCIPAARGSAAGERLSGRARP